MIRFKAMTVEGQYGCSGHFGLGDTKQEAMAKLQAAMKDDGSPWASVKGFILVSWENDPTLAPEEKVLLGYGTYSKHVKPEKVITRKPRSFKELTLKVNEPSAVDPRHVDTFDGAGVAKLP